MMKNNKLFEDNRGIAIVPIIIILVVVAAIGVAAYLFFKGKGLGVGNGAGNGEGDGNTQIVTNQDNSTDEETNVVDENEEVETHEQNDNAIDQFEGSIIKINVVGNEYFYDNERTTLDDFMIMIKGIDGDYIVEVMDDDASLDAYNDLIKMLKDNGVKCHEN